MLWLSLCSFLLFVPLAFWLPDKLYANELKSLYLFWLLLFVPMQGIYTALGAFFIGQKQPSLPVKTILFGNVLNLILAWLLIFGVPDFIPALGSTGAIIATNLALLAQIAILLRAFLHRSTFTHLDLPLLKKCVWVGLPNSLFSILEGLGWALFYTMMASLSTVHLTVAGIVQNVLLLSFFFADGLWRAVATLAGNAIGAEKREDVFKIVHSAFWLMTAFCLFLALFLWLMRGPISNWFLEGLPPEEQELIYPALLFGLGNAVIYKYLEGIRLAIGGALTAAADTRFLLATGALCIWAFMVLPVYLIVYRHEKSIEEALLICTFYTLISALLFIWRLRSGKWMKSADLVHSGSN